MEPVVAIITQARVGSTRLPNKLMLQLNDGMTLLDLHLQSIKKSKYNKNILVATTFEPGVEQLIDIAEKNDISCFQGSLDDVLDRFYQAALTIKPDYVVRLTSDCPLIDHQLLDQVIDATLEAKVDYGTNVFKESFPDGQDIEVVSFAALETAWKEAVLKSDREHVTPFIRNNSEHKNGTRFTSFSFDWTESFNFVIMTVDQQEDFETIQTLIDHCGLFRRWTEYTIFILENPQLFTNQSVIRNEGYYNSLKKD